MKGRQLAGLWTLGLLTLAPAPALACGRCGSSLVWQIYPPLLIWGWVGMGWFLALALVGRLTKRKVPLVPEPVTAVGLALVGWLVDAAMLGPMMALLFLAWAAVAQGLLLLRRRATSPPRILHAVGGLAVGAIAVTFLAETVSPTPRSPVDVILRWEGTAGANAALARLKRAEPGSVASYRALVQKAERRALGQAAERLAEVGDAAIDVPLMIEALARAQALGSGLAEDDLAAALGRLTGLSMPPETTAEQWSQAWQEQTGESWPGVPASRPP